MRSAAVRCAMSGWRRCRCATRQTARHNRWIAFWAAGTHGRDAALTVSATASAASRRWRMEACLAPAGCRRQRPAASRLSTAWPPSGPSGTTAKRHVEEDNSTGIARSTATPPTAAKRALRRSCRPGAATPCPAASKTASLAIGRPGTGAPRLVGLARSGGTAKCCATGTPTALAARLPCRRRRLALIIHNARRPIAPGAAGLSGAAAVPAAAAASGAGTGRSRWHPRMAARLAMSRTRRRWKPATLSRAGTSSAWTASGPIGPAGRPAHRPAAEASRSGRARSRRWPLSAAPQRPAKTGRWSSATPTSAVSRPLIARSRTGAPGATAPAPAAASRGGRDASPLTVAGTASSASAA
mmetsp:Transcript_100453/g.279730  ORF Transcript_100453/g.279730 Transcript_100453/m.279730 type:complete len:356 (-) Transcript_100453:1196-2263(-)